MYRHKKLTLLRKMCHVLKLNKMKMALKLYDSIDYNQSQEVSMSIPEYIQTLNEEQKEQFKIENPGLSPFLFMTEQEKKQYFERKNQQFFKKLQAKQKRLSKTRKIVKFQKKFEIKYFNQYQNPTDISSQSTENEEYHYGIHYSC